MRWKTDVVDRGATSGTQKGKSDVNTVCVHGEAEVVNGPGPEDLEDGSRHSGKGLGECKSMALL